MSTNDPADPTDAIAVRLRSAIDAGDPSAIAAILTDHPAQARAPIPWGTGPDPDPDGSADANADSDSDSDLHPNRSEPLVYAPNARFHRRFRGPSIASVAEALLAGGAPADGVHPADALDSGDTPLIAAASLGQAEIVGLLLDAGADSEIRRTYPGVPTGTALDYAAEFGMVEVVDLLVARGARVDTLRKAAGAGDPAPLSVFLEASEPPDRLEALRCACVCDRTAVADRLLRERGLDLHAEVRGATLLHWAAWEGKGRMVRWLVERGADPDRRDANHHLTPIEWAKYRADGVGPGHGHADVIAVLG